MVVRAGNGGVDVTRYATAESRRKGGLARAAKIREEKLTVRGRLARIAEEEAHSIAGVFLEAMRAEDEHGRPDHPARVRAATAFLAEGFGRPVQAMRDETEPTRGRVLVDGAGRADGGRGEGDAPPATKGSDRYLAGVALPRDMASRSAGESSALAACDQGARSADAPSVSDRTHSRVVRELAKPQLQQDLIVEHDLAGLLEAVPLTRRPLGS